MNVARKISNTSRWMSLMSGQVQVPIATTPRKAVYQRDLLTLYRYERDTPPTHDVPVLLVYSLINRPSILDLRPKRSVVQHLLQRGFDVFLLDWGVPQSIDRLAGLETYVDLYLRTVVREVCRVSGKPQATLFGYCMGGTLAAMYTALHPERVRNLLLLGAPFNFRSDELLYRWGCDPGKFDPDKIVDACGNAPPWAFDGFTMLRLDQKLPRLAALYDQVESADFVDSYLSMEQWINENIPMAGKVYSEFIKGCFHNNDLFEGRLRIGTRRVDLRRIQCPTLLVAGGADHLVPPETSFPLADVIAQAERMLFPSGHIGLSVSGAAHKTLWPKACDWLALHDAPCNEPATASF